MPLLDLRDILALPLNGDNATDTVLNGVHFNRTALEYYNYTLYSNNTLSNKSHCYLIFDQYRPFMFANGSFVNATSCYDPILHLRTRGVLGIVFGSAFAISIVFTLLNLNKHGKQHIREDRRFRVVGRRWQWYWMLFVAACGMISCYTSIDVDRDYLQDTALLLQSFFYYLMVPVTLAIVWEATRHWGSWSERQIVGLDPTSLVPSRRMEKVEFWLPLIFYALAWLNFFMVIPRSWTQIKLQHDDRLQRMIAEPAATDIRFKAGSVLAVCAVATICASLHHSLRHYKYSKRGILGDFGLLLTQTPVKLFFAIFLVGIKSAYGILSAWRFDLSVLKYNVGAGWPYGLGYAPILLIVIMLNIAGFVEENEDLQLMAMLRERNMALDAEMGLAKRSKKSHWWPWGKADTYMSPNERLRAMAKEIKPGRSSNAWAEQRNIELDDTTKLRDRSRARLPSDLFEDDLTPTPTIRTPVQSMLDLNAKPRALRTNSERGSVMTASTLNGRQPQKIRSMLDV